MDNSFSEFMNIWEIESHFKCPVVGSMLMVEKHKSILKKCGYDVSRLKPYEYHQNLMAKLHEENNVSVKVNNFIRSKSRKWMLQVRQMSEQEIRDLWETHLDSGSAAPLLYAIVAFLDTDVELLHDVYGQIHMQSHANMMGIFEVRQELSKAQAGIMREKKKLAQKVEENKKLVQLRKSDAERIARLEAENSGFRKQALASSELSQGSQRAEDVDKLRTRILDLQARLKEQENLLRLKERENRSLQIDLFSARSENDIIQQEVQSMLNGIQAGAVPPPCQQQDGCCSQETCQQYQLCAKRIFMIGGITKMKSYYKDIVEKAGGEFDYHDGYLKNANADLEAKVKKSDLVLCPVNCNSHNACLRVKKLCSRHNKQLKILSNSSLSAVTQAVFTNEASQQTTLN